MTPIKRGTARRLGLRRPVDVPRWIVTYTGHDLTEEQVDQLKKAFLEKWRTGKPTWISNPGPEIKPRSRWRFRR